MADVFVRWMIRRDIRDVLEIEWQSFPNYWGEDEFMDCLRQRNCIGMVAERDEKIEGFMIYEFRKRNLHLLNFAVSPRCRRQGIGRTMIEKLVAKLSQQRRQYITLEVRETNLDAQLFFRACGMEAKGIIRGHYEDTDEDAYSMILSLKSEAKANYSESPNS